MARLQSARVFVYQRLTAAVSEIMEHLEATFSQYEKEMESRHMTLLDSVCKAKERPLTAVQAVIKEEQQEWRLSLHQEDPEHPGGLHIKEEQQDLCSIQEVWSQLQGPQEEQIPDFPITAVLVTSEGDGEKAQLSQLHQRLCEEDREAEAPATCTAQHLGAGADGEEPCKASAAAFSGSDEIPRTSAVQVMMPQTDSVFDMMASMKKRAWSKRTSGRLDTLYL
ncbi:uncharacterized protein LOC121951403 isoform X3 [Plectropomus leopardus]|uniref:uncharacterized protein LOC121951403 isoform X3 n=1 Tax=Plectropomus leopardus TaxID=160734 RepID=UPI001C4B375C|nr:uncharacterized protein LOC121951403 isoform X3 [Plectropomus leopardus]